MRIAFLFAGQGTDLAAIGADLMSLDRVADLVRLAAAEVGTTADGLWARGGRLLEQTEVFQPTFIALAAGITLELRAAGVSPHIVAGHSLGELAAWCAAGCLTPEDAIRIAALRGRLMGARAREVGGGMLALHGAVAAQAEQILERHDVRGRVHIGALNAPGEVVLSGAEAALAAVSSACAATRVPVAGPWHSPAMSGAAELLGDALDRVRVAPLRIPLVSSVSGDVVEDGANMRELLRRQLVEPVRWTAAMHVVSRHEVTEIVTIGPGRLLRGLVRSNGLAGVRVHGTERPDLLEKTVERLCA